MNFLCVFSFNSTAQISTCNHFTNFRKNSNSQIMMQLCSATAETVLHQRGQPFSYLIKHSLPKIHKVWLPDGQCHVSHWLTTLKGTQDPSIQVNSEQVTVVFLPPGGTGETVLSGQNNIWKISSNTTEITSVIIKCVNTRNKDLISLQVSFPYFFPSLSIHPCLPSSQSSFYPHFLFNPHSFNIL